MTVSRRRSRAPRRAARPLVLAAAALLTAVLLSACASAVSTTSFTGAAKSVATTISDLQTDAQTRNDSNVCNKDLAPNIVSALNHSGTTCTNAINKQLGEADTFDLTVESIKVTGTTAKAVVRDTYNGKKRNDTLLLTLEGSRWKISGLS